MPPYMLFTELGLVALALNTLRSPPVNRRMARFARRCGRARVVRPCSISKNVPTPDPGASWQRRPAARIAVRVARARTWQGFQLGCHSCESATRTHTDPCRTDANRQAQLYTDWRRVHIYCHGPPANATYALDAGRNLRECAVKTCSALRAICIPKADVVLSGA